MRVYPALLLLGLLISFSFIPQGAGAAPSSATITITATVIGPTPTPVTPGGSGGGTGGPTGRGQPTGHSSNDILPAGAPPAVGPVAQPTAPPSAPPANLPSVSQPGPVAGPAALGIVPAAQAAQPGPLVPLYAILTTYSSILFVLLLFAFAAAYAFTKRDVLSRYQIWITLYLISMTGLLWAAFLYDRGGPISESVFLATTVVGLNLIVHILRFDRIVILIPAAGG